MVISDISIKRPVLATVAALVLVIFGLFGYRQLTVREYPDVDPPIVSVSTTYRGASAQIIETQVTQVIEDAVAGIEGIKTIESASRDESSSVSIEFQLTRDIEAATNDVRDRVARYISRLPDNVDPPRIAKTESNAQAMMWLSLTSDSMGRLELTDYAERFLVDRFSIVPGVASVRIGGGRRYAMRIWLDRRAMAARDITAQDIENAIRRQNIELPSGRIESVQREFAVRTESALKTPGEFRGIVIRKSGDYLVRLGEVARVELGPEDVRTELRANGRAAVGLGIIRQSKSNTLEVANGVKAEVAKIRGILPPGVQLETSYDQSVFISKSIDEVFKALGISMLLVVGVIFVFLRSLRATIIPAVAIPVSITATFFVLAALGYSINVLTLLAMVLAIGLVVDDAIVVLENIHRRLEEGEPPLLAALRGARQIGFAVVATTVVLVAVFVPLSFLEGNTGRIFREFGVAVAAAVIISSFVALSLTPMMCSKLLRPPAEEGAFYRFTETAFRRLNSGYRQLLQGALKMPLVIIALAVGVSGLALLLFQQIPREFAPTEDRGVFFVPIRGPEGASLDYMRRYVGEVEDRLNALRREGKADRVLTILAPGFGRPGAVNSAFAIVRLKPWRDRDFTQQDVVRQIFPQLLSVPGVRAFAVNPQGLGRHGFSAPLQMVIGGNSYEELSDWAQRVIARAGENPRLLNVVSDFEETRPELRVEIDRDRAADLGISIEDVGRTLETMLGGRFITTFDRGGKLYNVVVQARASDRQTPSDISNINVRSQSTGRLIPLSNVVSFRETAGAKTLNRVDRLRAVTISATPAPGYTLGEAIDYLEGIALAELPGQVRISFKGQSREYKDASAALLFTFAMALLIVFLALAAQFESFVHPLVILVAVPLAVTGALGSMMLAGLTLNIYSQIGVIMLIGLVAKNSILIVEFANQLRDEGRDIFTAVRDASVIRLRPILMTTISTALGALPLAMATGAGAESRTALGIVIIGGISFSMLLSLFVVPVLYLLMARFTRPVGTVARRLSELEGRHVNRATRQEAD